MSETAGNVVDRPSAQMGTVDVLLGLTAAVTNELRKKHGVDAGKIPVGLLCNVLHELQDDERFGPALSHLDFDRIGDNWISRTLEDFLFQAGTWGLHRVPNPSVATIALDEGRANRRLESLKRDYGDEAVASLEEMAKTFVSISDRLGSRE